jgi:hypothetical protein
MFQTFIALLFAYLASEFWLRPNPASRWIAIPLQAITVTVLSVTALGILQPWMVLAIVAAHLAASLLGLIGSKLIVSIVATDRVGLVSIISRQIFHLAAIAAVAVWFPSLFAEGWGSWLSADISHRYLQALTLGAGLIVNLNLGGALIGEAIAPIKKEVGNEFTEGLNNGSLYIGWLERGLVMIFVVVDQFAGAGFLMTAKSILRFSDATNTQHRRASEYIIIGTFMSFGWGLLISVLTVAVLRSW